MSPGEEKKQQKNNTPPYVTDILMSMSTSYHEYENEIRAVNKSSY